MHTVAVMGMAKNTGKTVALNHLLAQAAADDVAVGLTSIGRDGEERDAVFNFPKPPVSVWPGTVVATARSTLQRARVRHKLIDATGIHSPMGEIVLVKVLEAGDMEVAGASRSHDQHTCHRAAAPMRRADQLSGRRPGPQPACVTGHWPTAWCWPPARRWAVGWPTCCARRANAGAAGRAAGRCGHGGAMCRPV
jgi:hypothetical protein